MLANIICVIACVVGVLAAGIAGRTGDASAALTVTAYSTLMFGLAWVALVFRRPVVNKEAEGRVQDYLAEAAAEPADLPEGTTEEKCTAAKCERMAIEHVKSKIGFIRETEANRLVVGRLVRDYMNAMGMRPSHICRHAPMAVELYFVPTDVEIAAAEIRRTRTKAQYVKRLDAGPRVA